MMTPKVILCSGFGRDCSTDMNFCTGCGTPVGHTGPVKSTAPSGGAAGPRPGSAPTKTASRKRMPIWKYVLLGVVVTAFIGFLALVVVFLVTFDGEGFGQGMIMSSPKAYHESVSIIHTSPPDAEMEVFYELTLLADGSPMVSDDPIKFPYRWTVIGGRLPDGMSLNSSTGVIAGVPVKAGVFNFTVSAEGFSTSDAEVFRITVLPEGGGRGQD